MTCEEKIIQKIISDFKNLEGKCIIARQKRITIEASCDNFLDILEYVSSRLSFSMLCTITGLDLGEEIQLIYHLANDEGIVLNLKMNILKANPVIETVIGIYQGAALYERELVDLFGIQVKGILPGNRYPLPDSWPKGQYPLRKDWKPDMLSKCGGGS